MEKLLSSCLSYQLFVTFLPEKQRLSPAKNFVCNENKSLWQSAIQTETSVNFPLENSLCPASETEAICGFKIYFMACYYVVNLKKNSCKVWKRMTLKGTFLVHLSIKAGTHPPNRWTSEVFGETRMRLGKNMFGVFSCLGSFWSRVDVVGSDSACEVWGRGLSDVWAMDSLSGCVPAEWPFWLVVC